MPICNDLTHPSHLAGLKGLIFDCDGVLFDSWESNKQYYNFLLEHLGLAPMSPEQEAYVHSHTVHESMDCIVPKDMRHRIPEARAAVDYRRVVPFLRPEPGLYTVLGWLRGKGLKLAIATNRTTTMPLLMEHFSLRPYFPVVYTAGMTLGKPHPEMLHRILDRWGLARDTVAFIGDSSVDQQTALNAGVPFWAYGSPGLKARLHITDYYSLRRCLQKVLGC